MVSYNQSKLEAGKKIWSCPTCPRTFKAKQGLQQHVVTHDHNAKVECKICGKILKNPACLYFHTRNMHAKRERPRCLICNRTYFNIPTLRKHVQLIHSSKDHARFPCGFPGCGKSYRRLADCSQHERIEHSPNPIRFRCPICPKVFKRRQHLEQHGVTHSTEKPYACSTCGKTFKRKCHRKKHEDTHLDKSDRKIMWCPQCPRTFLSLLGFERHYHPEMVQGHLKPEQEKP